VAFPDADQTRVKRRTLREFEAFMAAIVDDLPDMVFLKEAENRRFAAEQLSATPI
jgi:hypothetical protein